MATHILTWFSNKNKENWKFIAAAYYSQITCKSIHLSFIQYGLIFLIICFSLPWKALQEAHTTSWGSRPIPAAIWASDFRENHEKFGRPCSRGRTTPKSSKDSGPGSMRASLSYWWTPGCGPWSPRSCVCFLQCLSRETEANY